MSQSAVARLNHDIKRLHTDQAARARDVRELRHDQRALKKDQKDLKQDKDAFVKDSKALNKERAIVGDLRDEKARLLAPLETRKAELQRAYDASISPLTGEGDPMLKAGLANVESQQAAVHARFDPKIAADNAKIVALKQSVQASRNDITRERHAISADRREIKHDRSMLNRDTARVHADRTRALHDLRPAEYKMGLKATNHVRAELGLNKVNHVIRPADPSHVTPEMRRLANAGMATARSMGGYTSHGLCATGVSRSIRHAMGITVYGNGNQIDNNLPRNKFKEVHMPLSQALKIPGMVLTWEHTSTRLGRIYGHTAITTGDGHTSCSDYIESNTLAGNARRTGLKIFMPI
jgi:phage host-nuclease inhibitor protein Gam